MPNQVSIGFDHSHNNKLTIENSAFTIFIQYLFLSELKLGKIEKGLTYEKMKQYEMFIIGVPYLSKFDSYEIEDIIEYVKKGGSLIVINDAGGDYENKNNLSELTKNFGIKFNSDYLFDNKTCSKNKTYSCIKDRKPRYLRHGRSLERLCAG